MNSAIVVLNWNDWRNTIDCLESIYQNDGNFDVFLIDNGSNLQNILKVLGWYKGQIISNRTFIKPGHKNSAAHHLSTSLRIKIQYFGQKERLAALFGPGRQNKNFLFPN